MNHYTYMLTNAIPVKGMMYYIGVRSCKCLPEDDKYFGSCDSFVEWQKKNGTHTIEKRIVATFANRKSAIEHEIKLHNLYDVARNKQFWNKAKQTAVGFDTTGIPVSDEARLKKSIKTKGVPKSNEHKRKIAEAHKGKTKSESHKKALSIAKTGTICHENTRIAASKKWKGVPKSDEHKKKISAANKGRKHEMLECPHCKKIGIKPNMNRWHFDNCKDLHK